MNLNVYNIALVAHVIGITIMAGTTFIDYIQFKQFWNIYPNDKMKGIVIEENLSRLQKYMGIGILLIILSGVLMMIYMHQIWGQQIWFRIKMGVLILIIINGLAIRRRLGAKLKKLLTEGAPVNLFDIKLSKIKRRVTWVHLFQMLFFVVIYVLSIFKFN